RPREAELLRAATRLFRERGFHATSMQDLAEALAMNRGSLYHYIESKDDLLWTIVVDALDRLTAAVAPALEPCDGAEPRSSAARLRAAIRAHLAFAAENRDEMSLVQVELRALTPDRRQALIAKRDAYEALWRGAIEEAIADGSLRMTDVRLAGIAILSACNWFTQWYRPDGPLTVEQIAHAFGDLYLCEGADPELPETHDEEAP
ncbi:MAG TPA: TetR/AcrR family transcriptional regulator, partial [Candidatus Limnocylindrales bacterium]